MEWHRVAWCSRGSPGRPPAPHVPKPGGSLSRVHPGAGEASNATQHINIPELYQIACIREGGENLLINSQFLVRFPILNYVRV